MASTIFPRFFSRPSIVGTLYPSDTQNIPLTPCHSLCTVYNSGAVYSSCSVELGLRPRPCLCRDGDTSSPSELGQVRITLDLLTPNRFRGAYAFPGQLSRRPHPVYFLLVDPIYMHINAWNNGHTLSAEMREKIEGRGQGQVGIFVTRDGHDRAETIFGSYLKNSHTCISA